MPSFNQGKLGLLLPHHSSKMLCLLMILTGLSGTTYFLKIHVDGLIIVYFSHGVLTFHL